MAGGIFNINNCPWMKSNPQQLHILSTYIQLHSSSYLQSYLEHNIVSGTNWRINEVGEEQVE